MGRGARWLSLAMAGVFALSVAVQWNDPDPALWMAIYGTACVLSLLASRGHVPLGVNAAALLAFAGLALVWLPSLVGSRPEAFSSFRMLASTDEAPREAGGLLLCTAWSAFLTTQAARDRKRS